MQFTIKSNIKGVRKNFTRMEKKLFPEANRRAINLTANAIQDEIKKTIPRVFSNPTPFTKKATKLTEAKRQSVNKHEIIAKVFFKDFHVYKPHYLSPQVDGGSRPKKGVESRLSHYMYPGKQARRNKYGNITGAQYSKMLSDVGVYSYTDAAGNTKRKNKGGTKKIKYFQIANSGSRTIYARAGRGKRNRRIVPQLVEGGRPTYRKRLPFYQIARSITKRQYPIFLERRLKRELAKLNQPSIR